MVTWQSCIRVCKPALHDQTTAIMVMTISNKIFYNLVMVNIKSVYLNYHCFLMLYIPVHIFGVTLCCTWLPRETVDIMTVNILSSKVNQYIFNITILSFSAYRNNTL